MVSNIASVEQPLPMSSSDDDDDSRPSMHELACRDLMERERLGIQRYGTKLRPNNGRDAFVDAYQEILDLIVYWRQIIDQLHQYDNKCHRAILMPDGRIAVRSSNENIELPWVINEVPAIYFSDDDIPLGSVPLVPLILSKNLNDICEALASLEHDRWAGWQRHIHNIIGQRNEDGSITIPPDAVNRWDRQMSVTYSELSDKEKELNRSEVQKYLMMIVGELHGSSNISRPNSQRYTSG